MGRVIERRKERRVNKAMDKGNKERVKRENTERRSENGVKKRWSVRKRSWRGIEKKQVDGGSTERGNK